MSESVTPDVDFLEDDTLRLSPDAVKQLETALSKSDAPPATLVELIKSLKRDRFTQQLNSLQLVAANARKSDFVLLQ